MSDSIIRLTMRLDVDTADGAFIVCERTPAPSDAGSVVDMYEDLLCDLCDRLKSVCESK